MKQNPPNPRVYVTVHVVNMALHTMVQHSQALPPPDNLDLYFAQLMREDSDTALQLLLAWQHLVPVTAFDEWLANTTMQKTLGDGATPGVPT